VRDPFAPQARLDLPALETAAAEAVRLLDDVIDVSAYPLPRQREQALASRRIGLGITGLADALILLGLDYGSAAARELAAGAMRGICRAAYRASVALARDKGAFPRFRAGPYLQAPFVAALPAGVRRDIARWGIRNSHLLAIAPAGTISLLAGNVSSGIEPVLGFLLQRSIRGPGGRSETHRLEDPAYLRWRELHGAAPLPPYFVTAEQLAPEDHLLMQAALQPHVDSAISKTINLPAGIGFEQFRGLYERAYALGLKGCTCFRPNPVSGSVLRSDGADAGCCSPERGGV
jgi:ribonucleoside-diphosphate reductase alpha chain